MDDETILARGGEDRDIEEYAKQNGADDFEKFKHPAPCTHCCDPDNGEACLGDRFVLPCICPQK